MTCEDLRVAQNHASSLACQTLRTCVVLSHHVRRVLRCNRGSRELRCKGAQSMEYCSCLLSAHQSEYTQCCTRVSDTCVRRLLLYRSQTWKIFAKASQATSECDSSQYRHRLVWAVLLRPAGQSTLECKAMRSTRSTIASRSPLDHDMAGHVLKV